MEWDGMEWDEMEWDGMGWDDMEWDEMEYEIRNFFQKCNLFMDSTHVMNAYVHLQQKMKKYMGEGYSWR